MATMTANLSLSGSIVGKLFGKAGNRMMNGFTDMLIKFDPETATDAQVDQLRNRIEDFSGQFVAAEDVMRKEQTDVTKLQESIDKNLRALGILQTKVKVLTVGSPERESLMNQARLLDTNVRQQTEQMVIEQQEAADAVEFYMAIQGMLDEADGKYKRSLEKRKKVIHDLKMAGLAQQRAAENLERVRTLDENNRRGQDGSSDVLDRVTQVTAKLKQEAKASNEAARRIGSAVEATSGGNDLADKILAGEEPVMPPSDPFALLDSLNKK